MNRWRAIAVGPSDEVNHKGLRCLLIAAALVGGNDDCKDNLRSY